MRLASFLGLEKLLNDELRHKRDAILYDFGFSNDYKSIWDFQKNLVEKRIARKIPDCLILVEHDHVLTMGRSAHIENILVRGMPIYEIERGGDVTYHGPGQLVAYPIVSLTERGLGVRQYVELLEAVISDTLLQFGLHGSGKLGQLTGVWIDEKRKIASIGVAASHWVAYHGFALNVTTDLSYFEKIKPCGFESSIMTSVAKEIGNDSIGVSDVKSKVVEAFSDRFDLEYERGSPDRIPG
jgi:lipoyl(octanoyl) transferase